MTSTVLQAGSS